MEVFGILIWVNDCCLMAIEQFFSQVMARAGYIRWDRDDVHFVLDQHAGVGSLQC